MVMVVALGWPFKARAGDKPVSRGLNASQSD
jgi:hypothetical protein